MITGTTSSTRRSDPPSGEGTPGHRTRGSVRRGDGRGTGQSTAGRRRYGQSRNGLYSCVHHLELVDSGGNTHTHTHDLRPRGQQVSETLGVVETRAPVLVVGERVRHPCVGPVVGGEVAARRSRRRQHAPRLSYWTMKPLALLIILASLFQCKVTFCYCL